MSLVILDLNGTLVDSTHHSRHTSAPPDARARSKYVYFRPGMREFLAWLFSVAHVAVWSSNERANVQALIELVFTPEQRQRLVFVWDRLYCDPCDTYERYGTVKPLAKVRRRLSTCPPQLLIVDDSQHKIVESDRASHVLVDEFIASDQTRYADRGLERLRQCLAARLGAGADACGATKPQR